MDISTLLEPIIIDLQKRSSARAVVLLDPAYLKGDMSAVAGVKSSDVKISLENLIEYVNDFAANTKKFLSGINLDDISAPRTVYISTEERRIYIFRFFVDEKTMKIPLYLGLTVKKDVESILEGKEIQNQIPQFVFDESWRSIKDIQKIYNHYFHPSNA
jgi:hypothetical protein